MNSGLIFFGTFTSMGLLTPAMEICEADVVVVGGGGAALRAALSAREAGASVRLITKGPLMRGGSTAAGVSELMSMGAAIGHADPRDCPQIHFQDTMRAAHGFVNEELVRVLAEEVRDRFWDLVKLGVPFEQRDGKYVQRWTDFATYPRTLAARGGRTGRAIAEALAKAAVSAGVSIDERVMAVALLRREGRMVGVLALDMENCALVEYRSKAVVLATGGPHAAFGRHVSTEEMTGDGQAMAFRAGAELVNMEFHQVGPACLYPAVSLFSGPMYWLLPRLFNGRGEEFLARYLPAGATPEAALKEKVFPFTTSNESRFVDIAIFSEVEEGRGTERGGILFDYTHIHPKTLSQEIPHTYRRLREAGLDLARAPVEVGIVFQCMNGGVRIASPDSESTLPGLFVAGEIAGGLRGPDRPGGNTLAECQVFGHRAGRAAARRAQEVPLLEPDRYELEAHLAEIGKYLSRASGPTPVEVLGELRSIMQRNCLVMKDRAGLCRALESVRAMAEKVSSEVVATTATLADALSLRNLLTCSEILLRACLHRTESRSGHYRTDFPETDEVNWRQSLVVRQDREGGMALIPYPYPFTPLGDAEPRACGLESSR